MLISVITFPSVYHAFRAKKILKEHQIPAELIPVPREISESCEGLAVKINRQYVDRAVTLLGSGGVVMLQKGIEINSQ